MLCRLSCCVILSLASAVLSFLTFSADFDGLFLLQRTTTDYDGLFLLQWTTTDFVGLFFRYTDNILKNFKIINWLIDCFFIRITTNYPLMAARSKII